jgi:hypothetical protein
MNVTLHKGVRKCISIGLEPETATLEVQALHEELNTEVFPAKESQIDHIWGSFCSFLTLVQFLLTLKHQTIHELSGFFLPAWNEVDINIDRDAWL